MNRFERPARSQNASQACSGPHDAVFWGTRRARCVSLKNQPSASPPSAATFRGISSGLRDALQPVEVISGDGQHLVASRILRGGHRVTREGQLRVIANCGQAQPEQPEKLAQITT